MMALDEGRFRPGRNSGRTGTIMSAIKKTIACLFLLALSAGNSLAYHPLASEDAAVIDPWRFEFEISHDVLQDADENHAVIAGYVPKIGLPGRVELDLSVPVIYAYRTRKTEEDGGYEKKTSQGGFGDLELLAKWLAREESNRLPGSALAGKIRFPSGDFERGLGEPKAGYQVLYAASKSYGAFLWHGNLGWDFNLDASDTLLFRTALDYEFYTRLHAVLEWDHRTDFEPGSGSDEAGILAGLIWNASANFSLDAGVRAGLIDTEDRFRLTTGITFYF